jgi:hypothetical protein
MVARSSSLVIALTRRFSIALISSAVTVLALATAGTNALPTTTKPPPIIDPWMITPTTDFLNVSYIFILIYKH